VMKALILGGGTDGEVLLLRAKFGGGSKDHLNAKEWHDILVPPPKSPPCPIGHLGETFGSLTAFTPCNLKFHPDKSHL
jgi:hypothetical protein